MASEATPMYREVEVPFVKQYKHLGNLLDSKMNFVQHFQQCLGMLSSSFDKLLSTVKSCCLPWVVAADSVALRVESVVSNRLALCIAVPGAEADLNRLQAAWARSLLGISGFHNGCPYLFPYFFVFACSWDAFSK